MPSPASPPPEDEDEEFHKAVLAQAAYLGMDPEEDEEFLWIAKQSLEAELPPGWEMAMGEGEHEGFPFYYNDELGESTWEHPMDKFFKEKFEKLKNEKKRRGRPGPSPQDRGRGGRSGEQEDYRQHEEGGRRQQDRDRDSGAERRPHAGGDREEDRRGGDTHGRGGSVSGRGGSSSSRVEGYDDLAMEDVDDFDFDGPSLNSRSQGQSRQQHGAGEAGAGSGRRKDPPSPGDHSVGRYDYDEGDRYDGLPRGREDKIGSPHSELSSSHHSRSERQRDRGPYLDEEHEHGRRGSEVRRAGNNYYDDGYYDDRDGRSPPRGLKDNSRRASKGAVEQQYGSPRMLGEEEEEEERGRRSSRGRHESWSPESGSSRRQQDEGPRGRGPQEDTKPAGGGHQGRSETQDMVIKAFESRLADATATISDLEKMLEQSEQDKRHALDDQREALEERQEADWKRREADWQKKQAEWEKERERLRASGDDASRQQQDSWAKEKQELTRKCREAEEDCDSLNDMLQEVRKELSEVKRSLRQEEEEVSRLKEARAAEAAGIKQEEVDELIETAKKRAAEEARRVAEREWEEKLSEAQRKARERESSLEIQLTAETERASQLESLHEKAEQEVIGLEAEVEHLSIKVEEFKRQLEEVEESRGQGEDTLHVELDNKHQEVIELKAALEESKARNTKLMQESLTLNAKTDSALREAEAARHQQEILQQQLEQLRLDKQVADAALVTTSRELAERDSTIGRLKITCNEMERELSGRKSELNRVQSQHAVTADREKELEDEMVRVKEEYQDKVTSLQRKIADLQNTKTALERQLTAAEDDAQDRIREAESAMETAEYDKKRTEERLAAAEQWRQKESARAKQAEAALEAVRADLTHAKSQLVHAQEDLVVAHAPLRERLQEAESQLSEEKRRAQALEAELDEQEHLHEEQLASLKAEVVARLPGLAQAAIKKVEEEWKDRWAWGSNELRGDPSGRGVEDAHMRIVALKAQLVEVQSKLQSQVSAERVANESLQRSLVKAEEEARRLRSELEETRAGGSGMNETAVTSRSGASVSHKKPDAMVGWEQAMHTSTMSLLQGHLQMLQSQFSAASRRAPYGGVDPSNNNQGVLSIAGGSTYPAVYTRGGESARRGRTAYTSPYRSRASRQSSRGVGGADLTTHDLDISITTAAVLNQDDEGLGHEIFDRSHSSPSTPSSSILLNNNLSDSGRSLSGSGSGFHEGYWRSKYIREEHAHQQASSPYGSTGGGAGYLHSVQQRLGSSGTKSRVKNVT